MEFHENRFSFNHSLPFSPNANANANPNAITNASFYVQCFYLFFVANGFPAKFKLESIIKFNAL